MSILRNILGAFMPHFESRRATATLASVGGELVLDVNGDESASVFINVSGTPNATYEVAGSPDGVNFYPVLAFPHAPASVGGTLPLPAQPLYTEAVAVATSRLLLLSCGQLQKIRLRLTAWTAGSFAITIISDAAASLSPYVRDQKGGTLLVSTTGAAGSAVTASAPAVVGLRHYIDRISVLRSVATAQTAAATPTVVSTSNIPGSPQFTFGVDAAALGMDKEGSFDFGGAGLSTLLVNTATTVICPATVGVIWRVNMAYRLGL